MEGRANLYSSRDSFFLRLVFSSMAPHRFYAMLRPPHSPLAGSTCTPLARGRRFRNNRAESQDSVWFITEEICRARRLGSRSSFVCRSPAETQSPAVPGGPLVRRASIHCRVSGRVHSGIHGKRPLLPCGTGRTDRAVSAG